MDAAPIKVLIVDDYELFATALQMWLHGRDGIEVVGVARDGEEAIDLAVRREADVVLMDIGLPKIDGLEATRRLRSLRPASRVIAVSGASKDEGQEAALTAGAVDFLTKGGIHEHLTSAVLRAMSPADPHTPLQ